VVQHNLHIALAEPHILGILKGYLLQVTQGLNYHRKTDLDDQTLRGYLNEAAREITRLTHRPCSILDPSTLHYKRPQMHPYLRDIIQQRAAWKEPKKRKEPVTLPMIEAIKLMAHELISPTSLMAAFLSVEYTVYDWERVVVYTGSRIAEYGQSSSATASTSSGFKLASGKRYAKVPLSQAAGEWAGYPIAFIAADFTFWNSSMCQLENSICLSDQASDVIFEIHIRFRFDKSKHNFSVRKFRRQKSIKFDLVIGVVNIFRRASILKIPPHEPIGQYRQRNGTTVCLRDKDVRDVLRAACCRAYPDPTHYCRVNITGIVAHSNRVTAALCLLLGGATIDEIAFRLRWEPGSVPTYLRECFVGIDEIMRKAIAGAYLTV
jgi:hypothetical protein